MTKKTVVIEGKGVLSLKKILHNATLYGFVCHETNCDMGYSWCKRCHKIKVTITAEVETKRRKK